MSNPQDENTPLVTVGIPLYKSARFLDSLIANIESIEEDSIEFLFSDQHCFDDSADRIRNHFADDPRVRVIKSTSEICWSDNYNLLLKEARGKYFRWLAHDDELPPRGMRKQIELLDKHGDAVCVLVNIQRVDLDGNPLSFIRRDKIRSLDPDQPWTIWYSLQIFANRRGAGAVKAMWRRKTLIDNQVFIRRTRDDNQPERVWLFGASLYGRFLYDEDYNYLKRIYPESTSAKWQTTWRNDLSYLGAGMGYLVSARGRAITICLFPILASIAMIFRPAIRFRRKCQMRRRRSTNI